MPYLPYWKLLSDLLFTQFETVLGHPEDHIPCLYDDPQINEQLGIKRSSCDRDKAPVSVARLGLNAESFCSYVSGVVNTDQTKVSIMATGMRHQLFVAYTHLTSLSATGAVLTFRLFCRKVVGPKLDAFIESHMERASCHPVQLMALIQKDEWNNGWSSRSGVVAYNGIVDLIGEERCATAAGSLRR